MTELSRVTELTDTHCHIQESDVRLDASDDDATVSRWKKLGFPSPALLADDARVAGVTRLICVGCTLADSERAISFAGTQPKVWASIGIHPHEAQAHNNRKTLEAFALLAERDKVVAIGECGLDYFYTHSPKEDQLAVLEYQLTLARERQLPMIFHVREAFNDFWPVFDRYPGVRGVIHSFSATKKELDEILSRGLYIGLNGIMTFTKREEQLEAARAIPLEKLVLETDAPFLTPVPFRGTICVPKHIRTTGVFLAHLRKESFEELAQATTKNAQDLFGLF